MDENATADEFKILLDYYEVRLNKNKEKRI